MKYRPPILLKCRRLLVQIQPSSLNLPRLYCYVDGPGVQVGASYGTASADPVVLVDIDLTGTTAGQLVAALYWWIASKRGSRR